MDLPEPDSPQLEALPISYQARAIYGLMYERREPLTMRQIRESLGELGAQEQLDRRRRELNRYFMIEKVRDGADVAYLLAAPKARSADADVGISERDRAFVLRHGTCAMCGRTPLLHGVVLQVDHKLPKAWGGSDGIENLQPLCEECNRGKKNLFASYAPNSDLIRAAWVHDSVHVRIGEFLKAFEGEWVRSDLVALVASRWDDVQEDWQRRMRELRAIGWDYETDRRREDGRVRSYYRLTAWQPWPDGSIREAIRRAGA